ncbi:hypothetical protein [Streptomyces sp. NPDC054784]
MRSSGQESSSPEGRDVSPEEDFANEILARYMAGDLDALVDSHAAGCDRINSWEQIREICVGRLQCSEGSQEDRVRWAEIAIVVIGKKDLANKKSKYVPAIEEVRIRVYTINTFGSDRSVDMRNPDKLIRLVMGVLDIDYERAASSACNWQALPADEILRLRRIKNLMSALQTIDPSILDSPAGNRVKPWIELAPRLP